MPDCGGWANTGLGERIVRMFQTYRQVYGSPRMQAALRAEGSTAGASEWLGSCASTN